MDRELKRRTLRRRKTGFSLIELLAVMAIAAILVVGIGSVSSAGGLSLAAQGEIVRDTINLARSEALSRDTPVQVRFYKIPTTSATDLQYRGIQLFQIDQSGNASPINRFQTLSSPIILESGTPAYASLLYGNVTSVNGNSPIPGSSTPYTYSGFTFRPDGSTDLSATSSNNNGDTWFVMVRSELDKASPPKNFYVVQVDPIDGRVAVFRP